ncbi:Uncharacterized protein TPAR_03278 [Tolypocladium paradoxum]|uniref:Uncharacterized protein n=1 Tax=Tolypocladium paradoxum TaxID=94208 RepID=A0A2S4L2C1_9HYPO|nr:Uncharacterized protein TPAR_03278 [Tolypocladium paradoxum]
MCCQREQSRAYRIMKMLHNHERRQEIEGKMMECTLTMHAAVRIVEDTMMTGYRGRETDAKSSSAEAQEGILGDGEL